MTRGGGEKVYGERFRVEVWAVDSSEQGRRREGKEGVVGSRCAFVVDGMDRFNCGRVEGHSPDGPFGLRDEVNEG